MLVLKKVWNQITDWVGYLPKKAEKKRNESNFKSNKKLKLFSKVELVKGNKYPLGL
jgi:hypothetical protein